MFANPSRIHKYLYVEKTPTWKVRSLYLFGIISWLLVVYGFSGIITVDPFYRWFVAPILGLITIYHLLSFGINIFYRQFNLSKHHKLVKSFWEYNKEPSVDIFLPICGEDIEVLKNTWWHVFNLPYKNKKVYVLDDSTEGCEEHKKIARSFGFNYLERPNKGENKKAGNLKYAFERTNGEFIVIFDADFAPHPDFLYETLPYTSYSNVGIIQTPQYFETTPEVYKHSSLAYVAGYREELFYRVIQVAKDRFDAAICCGSNSLHRRSAIESIGGYRQVTASEDSRTGFSLLAKGWITRYIPVILAVGICPDNVYAYYHQQHRWCRGRSELVLSKEFRTAPVSFLKKITNTTGFLSFLLRPLEILLSFQLFWVLFLYNDFISAGNILILYPYLIFSLIMIPLFQIAKFKKEVLFAASIQTFASVHSVISVLMGRTVGWIATNSKHTTISSAFRQTTRLVAIYVTSYLLLIALAIYAGYLHPFDYNYWSIQFWIFWNLGLSSFLLWQLLRTSKNMKAKKEIERDIQTNYEKLSQRFNIENIIELVGIISLGFLFFEVVFGYLGFILGYTVTNLTLPLSFALYCLLLILSLVFVKQIRAYRLNVSVSLFVFLILSSITFFVSQQYFSRTYDTSWDGQGYHSNGIISFANGWNPIYEKDLPLKFPDASIHVKGYPKALWFIQSSIYLSAGRIDAAKATNMTVLLIALAFSYTFLRKLKISIPASLLIALSLVFQPPFFIQIFSFTEDLFSYEMMLIAISALGLFILETNINKNILAFIIADLFLVGTKFSNLPIAVALGIIFAFVFFTAKFDLENIRINKALATMLVIGGLIFSLIPYATNTIYYKHLLFPTNIKAISASYKDDNTPKNLYDSNKLTLLFYSVFSKSQVKAMGKDDPLNTAVLKIPFTFTKEEIMQSASIFNNRVGSAGFLFSGIVVLTVLIGILMVWLRSKIGNRNKLAISVVGSLVGISIIITLVNPTPTLIRLNNQIVLIPFIIVVSALVLFRNSNLIKSLTYITIIFMCINTLVFSVSVIQRRIRETEIIDSQLITMQKSSNYAVWAGNFYSNYIRLSEHQIPFVIESNLDCLTDLLLYSHNTTKFCKISAYHGFKRKVQRTYW